MDRSKSKFDTDLAESLYSDDPDDNIGSVDELGWAGRFNDELTIITEDSDGFVWTDTYANKADFETHWQDILDTYQRHEYGLLA